MTMLNHDPNNDWASLIRNSNALARVEREGKGIRYDGNLHL